MELIKEFELLSIPHTTEFINKIQAVKRIKEANIRFNLIYKVSDDSRSTTVKFIENPTIINYRE